MTSPDSAGTPPAPSAGWYPEGQQLRWWDGVQWTPQVRPLETNVYAPTPLTDLRAPEGVQTSTTSLTVLCVLAVLSAFPVLFVDWGSLVDPRLALDPARYLAGLGVFTLSYILTIIVSWSIWGVSVWLAYRDWKELTARGVPRPFHWAWTFLGGLIYLFGRSVVVRRRTGSGGWPLWIGVLTAVLTLVSLTIITVDITSTMIDGILELERTGQLGRTP